MNKSTTEYLQSSIQVGIYEYTGFFKLAWGHWIYLSSDKLPAPAAAGELQEMQAIIAQRVA